MNKLVLTVAAVLAATPAFANGQDDTTWDPPPRYNHPYHGYLRVYKMDHDLLVEACHAFETEGNYFVTNNQRGCSWHSDDYSKCIVFLTNRTFMKQSPAAVLRHEIGHCNGWPGDHPDK